MLRPGLAVDRANALVRNRGVTDDAARLVGAEGWVSASTGQRRGPEIWPWTGYKRAKGAAARCPLEHLCSQVWVL